MLDNDFNAGRTPSFAVETRRTSGRRGTIPAYIQVAAALRRRIELGDWQPSAQISTLEELEEEFQVARVTVRQAIELLEKEGLVTRQQGRGTFVSDTVDDRRWLALQTSWPGAVDALRSNVLKYIKVSHPPALPRLREGEGKLAGEYVFLRSVQLKDNIPYGVVNVHLAKDIFDRKRDVFRKHAALPVLADMNLDISHARQTVLVGTADPEIAALLHISLSAPTAEVRWVVRDASDTAIYVSEITYRADCVKMSIDYFEETATPSRRRASSASSTR